MPTTRSRTLKSGTELERDREFEALGLGIAPGLPGDDRSELVERAEIGTGQPWRGAPAAGPSAEVIDRTVERASDRRRVHAAVGMPAGRRISNEVIDELLAGASTEEEIAGSGGLLAELTKRLVERAMEVELTDHVGYEPHAEPPGGAGNTRNGSTPKTLICEHGPVGIETPRDRDGSFAPKIVRKRQRRFEGFDDKILALYSRGLSVRDISAHLEEKAAASGRLSPPRGDQRDWRPLYIGRSRPFTTVQSRDG
jgi:mutator family transposase